MVLRGLPHPRARPANGDYHPWASVALASLLRDLGLRTVHAEIISAYVRPGDPTEIQFDVHPQTADRINRVKRGTKRSTLPDTVHLGVWMDNAALGAAYALRQARKQQPALQQARMTPGRAGGTPGAVRTRQPHTPLPPPPQSPMPPPAEPHEPQVALTFTPGTTRSGRPSLAGPIHQPLPASPLHPAPSPPPPPPPSAAETPALLTAPQEVYQRSPAPQRSAHRWARPGKPLTVVNMRSNPIVPAAPSTPGALARAPRAVTRATAWANPLTA